MADRERVPLEYQSQLADEYETEVPPEDEAYSLEEILEEYGGGLERKLSEGAPSPETGEAGTEPGKQGGLRAGLASLAGRLKREHGSAQASPEGEDRLEKHAQSAASRRDSLAEEHEADSPASRPDSGEQVSFADMAKETAERAAGVWNGLKNFLARLRGPLSGGIAAVRRTLAGIRLPSIPAGTRIPVLSAAADRIEAERRRRRPKRNRVPVPIPGGRRRAKPVPPEDVDLPENAELLEDAEPPRDIEMPVDTEPPESVEPRETLEPDAPPDALEEPAASEVGPEDETDREPESGPAVEAEAPGDTDGLEETIEYGAEKPPQEPSSEADDAGGTAEAGDSQPREGRSRDADGTGKDGTGKDRTGKDGTGKDRPRDADRTGKDGTGEDKGGKGREEQQGADRAGQARKRRPLFRRPLLRRRVPDEIPIGPEIPLHDAAARFREAYTRRLVPPLALAAGGLPTLLLLLERTGIYFPLWSGNIPFRSFLTLLCLGAAAYLCRQVFTGSVTAFACGVSAAAACVDGLIRLAAPARSPGDGFGAVACLALIVAQWGVSLESRGRFEAFRAASLDDEPPFLVTDMEQGACKQRGAATGFYSTAMRPDSSTVWQAVLLPLTLALSVVFAGISSFGQDRGADFFLNWSAILAAGATFTLPLCWGLPWARLARRLQKSGGAVAGWAGAEKISRQKNMIVTDADLFPAGAVQLNGIRLFGGGMDKAVSYAAAMAREASCGLERPFQELLHAELGEAAETPEVEEFNFYEEGGYGGTIDGEAVLLGTAAFLRRMGVLLPRDLKLSGGMYLAVDHRLLAVFAIRYNPSDNVDYALRLMRRSGVTPLLAVRDPNINPAMLQRKFRRRIPVKYPPLAGRIALSEVEFDREAPRALLFRDGLLPYAEVVVGCRRLCGGVRRATALSEFGSLAGMLLTFYLCSQAKFELLTPLSLTVFLLLWLLPVLLVMELF